MKRKPRCLFAGFISGERQITLHVMFDRGSMVPLPVIGDLVAGPMIQPETTVTSSAIDDNRLIVGISRTTIPGSSSNPIYRFFPVAATGDVGVERTDHSGHPAPSDDRAFEMPIPGRRKIAAK